MTKKTPKKKKTNNLMNINQKKRIIICLGSFFVIFLILVGRLAYFQFIVGNKLKEAAYTNQTINKIISPNRGTIYDSTGKSLAISAKVDTVTINPTKIAEKNKEKLAKAFADIFELDYEETFQKVTSTASVETIIKKVEKDKINTLTNWMNENKLSIGINIDEDNKRYYPYENLASNLIGFCGTDNQGLWGIESSWDDVLTGTQGKVTTSADSSLSRTEIPDENSKYIAAENGSDLVLSIDYYIQTIVEKYLKQAVEENNCTRGGNVIIMKPSTGDILAMATYPNYNLNTPFEATDLAITTNWNELSNTDKLNEMWKNRAITNGYEPGSTFKSIIASIAIEEGIIDPYKENQFVCTGYEQVADRKIACWRQNPHGYQSLEDALKNSCNPAFIQLGQKIGIRTLYKYFNAFGFFNKTNIKLEGEARGYFYEENKVKLPELATLSFGQRFTITPLQLITAVSAIANNGILVEPRIVKQLKNSDLNTVTNLETVEINRVLSETTCNTMKKLLESVVVNGTGGYAKVNGYSVGGKTGTSEPPVNKEEEGYTASYVAISPTSNAQVAILVTLYDPNGDSHQGGQIAGPVVSQILTEVLPYLNIPKDLDSSNTPTTLSNTITTPNFKNMTVASAKKKIEELGLAVKINTAENIDEELIVHQTPISGTKVLENSIIYLYTEKNNTAISATVPNLKDLSLVEAKNKLISSNLNISFEGTGNVISQNISAGTSVEAGTIIKVTLKQKLTDTH